MIVCSCHVFSDHDVRDAVSSAEQLPRNAKQLYGCLGCSAECGRCARTIQSIIDEGCLRKALCVPKTKLGSIGSEVRQGGRLKL